MIALLSGVAGVAFLWWLTKTFAQLKPARIAGWMKRGGGMAALVVAATLAVRGRLDMAALIGGVGVWLLGWSAVPSLRGLSFFSSARAEPSRMRSPLIELALDRSGRLDGIVRAGPFAGRALDGMSEDELDRLLAQCRSADPAGVDLLLAYLDRRFARGREHAEGDAHARRRADPQSGTMTHEEAHEILGLQPGADEEAVRQAHRGLIKKLHPDHGGSTYLASRVNQAKDFLLNRHR